MFVIWRDYGQEPLGIYAQHYDQAGARLWQENGIPVMGNGLGAEDFAAAPDGAGGLIGHSCGVGCTAVPNPWRVFRKGSATSTGRGQRGKLGDCGDPV